MASKSSPDDLSSFRVEKAPASVYYVPNFISEEEEKYLLNQVYSAPKPKWTQLSNRRLQNWGGLPHPKGMVAEKLPQWLDVYAHRIAKLGVFEDQIPNHVLVNEYKPQQGIMPHEDGPLFYPVVTTINLESHSVLQFYDHSSKKEYGHEEYNHLCLLDKWTPTEDENSLEPKFSLLLQPRSLNILKHSAYTDYLHGIEERSEDTTDERMLNLAAAGQTVGETLVRGVRVSLTIRYVQKTLKIKLMLGKR